MADRDGFVIDIFSNDDDFSLETPSIRKVTTKPGSGLMMVSGYGTDGSESPQSFGLKDDFVRREALETGDLVDQTVVPMEIEDLEEGEYLSDFNAEEELERLYETELTHKKGDEQPKTGDILTEEQEGKSKAKKKEKKHKKKKKKQKTEDGKKSEKRRESVENKGTSNRSGSSENRHRRKLSVGEDSNHSKESRRHRDDDRHQRSNSGLSEKVKEGSSRNREKSREGKHSHRDSSKSKHHGASANHHEVEGLGHGDRGFRERGDSRRVERLEAEPRWERRVKVVNKDTGRNNRHRVENITIAIDQSFPEEKGGNGKGKARKGREGGSMEDRETARRSKKRNESVSESDGDVRAKKGHTKEKKKEKRKEKGRKTSEALEPDIVKESEKRHRDRKKKKEENEGQRARSLSTEHKTKHKRNKRTASKSVERKKEKKKKKKKKEGKKDRQRTVSHSSHHSMERVPERIISAPTELLTDKPEGEKDLDLEMLKDREFNTLDQRLQEIERRLALDTDVSSDDNDGEMDSMQRLGHLSGGQTSESEGKVPEGGQHFTPDHGESSLDEQGEDVGKEAGTTEGMVLPMQSAWAEPEEEELSGEALFMKEYGLELEEQPEPEHVTDAADGTENCLAATDTSVNFSWKVGVRDKKKGGFLPAFEKEEDAGIDRAQQFTDSKRIEEDYTREDHGLEIVTAKWKPIGGTEELEEISDDEVGVPEEELHVGVGNDDRQDLKQGTDRLSPSMVLAHEEMDSWNDLRDHDNAIYDPSQNLEQISDQEDIFDSIAKEEELNRDQVGQISDGEKDVVERQNSNESGKSDTGKWKPVGLTKVKAVSQQLLLTPSDEYCEFKEKDTVQEASHREHGWDTKGERRRSGEHKDSHRHKRDHKSERDRRSDRDHKSERDHKQTDAKEKDDKYRHRKGHAEKDHHHRDDSRRDRHHHTTREEPTEVDSPVTPHKHSDGPLAVTQKIERTADKYRKKPARKSVDKPASDIGYAKEDKQAHSESRRRSRSRDKDHEGELSKRTERKKSTASSPERDLDGKESLADTVAEGSSHRKGSVKEQSDEGKGVVKSTLDSDITEAVTEFVHEDVSDEEISYFDDKSGHDLTTDTIQDVFRGQSPQDINEVPKSLNDAKEKRIKRPHASEIVDTSVTPKKAKEDGMERKKKRVKDAGKKSKDDLFDDIFGNDGTAEEERDGLANLLTDPEPFKRMSTDFSPEKAVEKEKRKEKHHRKKSEESKHHRKKETRRKRESESALTSEISTKVSKAEAKAEPERIPGIMDEDDIVARNEGKDSSEDAAPREIPLLFDALPKIDVVRSNSEEKENDRSSLLKNSMDSLNEMNLRTEGGFEDLSPYNPEELTPIDLSDSPEGGMDLQGESIAAAIESIEKKQETLLANINFETILREKAREQVRQRKADQRGSDLVEKLSNDPRENKEGMVDYLIRQSRVEDEMKTVLKQYYRKKEITKEEYKNILKKAVPQVTMSNSPIIPEKIRNLMRKFVCKTKGQRILNEHKPNQPVGSKKKGTYKKYKPPKLPEPKPKEKRDSVRKTTSNPSGSGYGTQLKILNPNLPMPPVL